MNIFPSEFFNGSHVFTFQTLTNVNVTLSFVGVAPVWILRAAFSVTAHWDTSCHHPVRTVWVSLSPQHINLPSITGKEQGSVLTNLLFEEHMKSSLLKGGNWDSLHLDAGCVFSGCLSDTLEWAGIPLVGLFFYCKPRDCWGALWMSLWCHPPLGKNGKAALCIVHLCPASSHLLRQTPLCAPVPAHRAACTSWTRCSLNPLLRETLGFFICPELCRDARKDIRRLKTNDWSLDIATYCFS